MSGQSTFKTYQEFGSVGNLGAALNSAVTLDVRGFSTIACHLFIPAGGEVTFEASYDGVNFSAVTLRGMESDVYEKTIALTDDLVGSIIGAKSFRFRTSKAGAAAGYVIGKLIREVATLEGIEFGWPPHRFGFDAVHKDASFTTQQTATALWTPASGKTYYCTEFAVIVGGSTDGIISIFDGTDEAGKRLFRGNIEVATNKQFVFEHTFKTPFKGAAADSVLKVTTSAALTVDILLHGYEV